MVFHYVLRFSRANGPISHSSGTCFFIYQR